MKIEISPEEARNLAALLGDPDWMLAIKHWHKRLNHQPVSSGKDLNLSPEEWETFSQQLLKTGWFTTEKKGLTPNKFGNDFLYGATELQLARAEKKAGYSQIEAMLRTLPSGPAVDIGCGTGLLLVMVARLGFDPLYGYDLTESQLMIAATLLYPFSANVNLFQKDATPLAEIEDASIAVVMARSSSNYFYQDQLAATLKRVLRRGGYLLSECPGPSYYWGQVTRPRIDRAGSWRRTMSYARTIARTWIFTATGKQPYLGAKTPEIAWSKAVIRRFSEMADLDIIKVRPATTLSRGHLVLFRKPK